jgi:hypothetical protein
MATRSDFFILDGARVWQQDSPVTVRHAGADTACLPTNRTKDFRFNFL